MKDISEKSFDSRAAWKTLLLLGPMILSCPGSAWSQQRAAQEYCGQLAYLKEGEPAKRGFYLKTAEFIARIDVQGQEATAVSLNKAMKSQQKQIGTCLTGMLAGEAGDTPASLRTLSGVGSIRNYKNGKPPDSLAILKLGLSYEGFWDIAPREGRMNVFTDDTAGKIKSITIDIREPIHDASEDRVFESISIAELLSGKTLALPRSAAAPLVTVTAGEDFTAMGGGIKVTFKTENGSESQYVKFKRDLETRKYWLWKDDILVQKIAITLRGLTETSGYVGSYRLN